MTVDPYTPVTWISERAVKVNSCYVYVNSLNMGVAVGKMQDKDEMGQKIEQYPLHRSKNRNGMNDGAVQNEVRTKTWSLYVRQFLVPTSYLWKSMGTGYTLIMADWIKSTTEWNPLLLFRRGLVKKVIKNWQSSSAWFLTNVSITCRYDIDYIGRLSVYTQYGPKLWYQAPLK